MQNVHWVYRTSVPVFAGTHELLEYLPWMCPEETQRFPFPCRCVSHYIYGQDILIKSCGDDEICCQKMPCDEHVPHEFTFRHIAGCTRCNQI